MSIYTFSGVCSLVTLIAINIISYIRARAQPVVKVFILLNIFISFWVVGCLIQSITDNHFFAKLADILLYTGAIFSPVIYLNLILVITGKIVQRKGVLFLGYFIGSIFFIFNIIPALRPFFIRDVLCLTNFRFIADPAIGWYLYIGFYFTFASLTLWEIFNAFKRLSGDRGEQLKYFLMASVAIVVAGSAYFLIVFNQAFIPIDHSLTIAYGVITAYAILKHQLLDIRVAITRVGIFTIVYGAILGISFYLGYFTKNWFLSTSLTVILASAGPFIYIRLRKQIEGLLLQEQKHKFIEEEQIRRHRAMDHFSSSLAHEIDNPMHSVSGLAEVIRLKVTEDLKGIISKEDQNYLRSRLGQLIKDSGRVSKMVKAIREFSSQTSGALTTVKIDEVIDAFMSIVGPQFKEDSIVFEKKVEEDIQLKGNKIHLEEVLMNLSINAFLAVNNTQLTTKILHLRIYRNSPKT
ncbi:MAG: hypothetical protein GY858_00860, partial [Candidatus Omnitrophica bacterium]|nr:hypothetical protein [Candidatus Omnitrophota bacterium]